MGKYKLGWKTRGLLVA